ncbi:hypothetical protein [Streptosporangium saharense]|uniref:Uncharacterized protein n=1 Tax=Streptosporangium saharense TaxID=1706840 RepID=A0A7W7QQU3_9ACTN|nr:hypothetical protein [Streptosporangium saharense]MBB4917411.1 hypothetical protein [Streptosporangium saharense]
MNSLMSAMAFLLLVVLLAGSVTDPEQSARTPTQVSARIATASAPRWVGWAGAVLIAAPLYALLVATRGALWLALAALAWAACRAASALAMDGRALRMVRTAGGRA